MALSINNCFRLFFSSAPTLPNPSLPPLSRSKEAGWRRNCLAAAAVAVVTIGAASAMELPTALAAAATDTERWSEKRECPPWHANSLENVVPENLPRPLPHRGFDDIAAYRDAPALAGGTRLHRYGRGCYSL